MEQEEEENICDGVIYADLGRRSRLSTRWGSYLRVCTSTGGSSSGVTIWGCNLRRGGGLSPVFNPGFKVMLQVAGQRIAFCRRPVNTASRSGWTASDTEQ